MKMFLITLFFGIFGVHKFINGQKGMGILYFFTLGLFGVGWIIDVINAFINIFSPPNIKTVQSSSMSKYSNLSTVAIDFNDNGFKYATNDNMFQLQQLIIPGQSKLIMSLDELESHGYRAIERYAQIIEDCEKIVHNTENAETFFSRYNLLLDTLNNLSHFEPFFSFHGYIPSDKYRYYIDKKQHFIQLLANRLYNKALIKADNLKTEKGKINQFNKALELIMNYKVEMTNETVNHIKNKFNTKVNNDDDISLLTNNSYTYNYKIDE